MKAMIRGGTVVLKTLSLRVRQALPDNTVSFVWYDTHGYVAGGCKVYTCNIVQVHHES